MNALSHTVLLGPVPVSLGTLLAAMALFVALAVGGLVARRHGVAVGDRLLNLVLVALISARAVFVLRYLHLYDGVPSVFDIRDGGFDVPGGLLGAALYAAWLLLRHPRARRALATGLVAGTATFMVTAGALVMLDQQARPVPDLPLTTLAGEALTLPSLGQASGKPMVVNVWATWCPPCRREMPVLEAAQRERDDLTFVFVNQGESPVQVGGFLEEEALMLDNVLLDRQSAFGPTVGALALPTTLYYDARGRLVDVHVGEVSRATLQRGLDRLTSR